MSILKKRSVAILITVVVAFAAMVFGVNRSVTRAVTEIEQVFYDGAMNPQGFREPSANAQLDRIANAAITLATLLQGHPGLENYADSVLVVRRNLLAAESITDKGAAYIDLDDAFARLVQAAERADLTEREQEALASHSQTFSGAQSILARESRRYNEMLIELWDNMAVWVRPIAPARPSFPKPAAFLDRGA